MTHPQELVRVFATCALYFVLNVVRHSVDKFSVEIRGSCFR